jgi:hypothetical protein
MTTNNLYLITPIYGSEEYNTVAIRFNPSSLKSQVDAAGEAIETHGFSHVAFSARFGVLTLTEPLPSENLYFTLTEPMDTRYCTGFLLIAENLFWWRVFLPGDETAETVLFTLDDREALFEYA